MTELEKLAIEYVKTRAAKEKAHEVFSKLWAGKPEQVNDELAKILAKAYENVVYANTLEHSAFNELSWCVREVKQCQVKE